MSGQVTQAKEESSKEFYTYHSVLVLNFKINKSKVNSFFSFYHLIMEEKSNSFLIIERGILSKTTSGIDSSVILFTNFLNIAPFSGQTIIFKAFLAKLLVDFISWNTAYWFGYQKVHIVTGQILVLYMVIEFTTM